MNLATIQAKRPARQRLRCGVLSVPCLLLVLAVTSAAMLARWVSFVVFDRDVIAAEFSPDGRYLAAHDDKTMRVVDGVSSGKLKDHD